MRTGLDLERRLLGSSVQDFPPANLSSDPDAHLGLTSHLPYPSKWPVPVSATRDGNSLAAEETVGCLGM